MSESGLIDDSNLAEPRPHRENEERRPQDPGEFLSIFSECVELKSPADSILPLTWPQPTHYQGPLEEAAERGRVISLKKEGRNSLRALQEGQGVDYRVHQFYSCLSTPLKSQSLRTQGFPVSVVSQW